MFSTHHKTENIDDIVIFLSPPQNVSRSGRAGGVAQLGRLHALDYHRRRGPLRMSWGVSQI